ncbi:hypothetical protein [Fonticella tunisiensis]|uniref:Uncharacterized protein n=1 Tax=Fonticella tunisiensis TaxID=1096341 RepID=A0A4R7K973_9CLOT|nr:hypothetical protein [Fonticella tunisiensis]TDT50539.1 hypothetical protein EDD71_1272 [Fonticella tunisiensis]
MKKLIIFILSSLLLFTSCTNKWNVKNGSSQGNRTTGETKIEVKNTTNIQDKLTGIRGVNLIYNKDLNLNFEGFNKVFLSIDGFRISKSPYRTDFRVMKTVDHSISLLEDKNMDYYINITSGPGISKKDGLYSIFQNKTEALYFTKMVEEIISRYRNKPHFMGIALDIGEGSIPAERYYDTMGYIISKVQSKYSDINIVLNLHPMTFEEDLNDIYLPDFNNVTLNLPITFSAISYPGYAKGVEKSYDIDKNVLLDKLTSYMKLADKHKSKLMVSINSPWVDKTEILLQDMFELVKMLKFDFNISYGNSEDAFDFRTNEEVLKVIKRHSL